MPKAKPSVLDGFKIYEVVQSNKTIRVRVPASWKCTFGPLAPGSKTYNGRDALALRFYEENTKQRACFTNVLSFVDITSLEIWEKHQWTEEEKQSRKDEKGGKEKGSKEWGYSWVKVENDI